MTTTEIKIRTRLLAGDGHIYQVVRFTPQRAYVERVSTAPIIIPRSEFYHTNWVSIPLVPLHGNSEKYIDNYRFLMTRNDYITFDPNLSSAEIDNLVTNINEETLHYRVAITKTLDTYRAAVNAGRQRLLDVIAFQNVTAE